MTRFRVQKKFEESADLMAAINSSINDGEVNVTNLQREMMKAGLISELFYEELDYDDLSEYEDEIENVIKEITIPKVNDKVDELPKLPVYVPIKEEQQDKVPVLEPS